MLTVRTVVVHTNYTSLGLNSDGSSLYQLVQSATRLAQTAPRLDHGYSRKLLILLPFWLLGGRLRVSIGECAG